MIQDEFGQFFGFNEEFVFKIHIATPLNSLRSEQPVDIFQTQQGTVIGITQPPPTEGAWSALFSNLSKSGLQLCSKALQAPSAGGGCVIPTTVPYSLVSKKSEKAGQCIGEKSQNLFFQGEFTTSAQFFDYIYQKKIII